MDLGDELEDAGAVVVKSAAKIAVIGATIFVGIGLLGYYTTKKIKASNQRKKLASANKSVSSDEDIDDDVLELGA